MARGNLTGGDGLVRRLKAIGLDLIDVSVGFSIAGAAIPWGPGFMAPIAERVRRENGCTNRCTGGANRRYDSNRYDKLN